MNLFFKHFIILIFVGIFLICCGRNSNDKNKLEKKINSSLGILDRYNWKNFFEIDTIKLKMPADIFIDMIVQKSYISRNGFIYLWDAQQYLYRFAPDGYYINRLDRIGKGPGEYTQIGDYSVDINDNVYVVNLYDGVAFKYDSEFEFVKKLEYKDYNTFGACEVDDKNNFIMLKPFSLNEKPVHFLDKDFNLKWRQGKIDSIGLSNDNEIRWCMGDVQAEDNIVYYSHSHYYKIFRVDYNGNKLSPIAPYAPHFIKMDKSGKEFGNSISRLISFFKIADLVYLHIIYPTTILSQRNKARYDIVSVNGKILAKDILRKRHTRFSKCYGNKFMEVYFTDENDEEKIDLIVVTYKLKADYD